MCQQVTYSYKCTDYRCTKKNKTWKTDKHPTLEFCTGMSTMGQCTGHQPATTRTVLQKCPVCLNRPKVY